MAQELRRYWESYLRVPLEPAARQAKTKQLEVFLSWSLHWATQSEPNSLPEFSDMHSVSNLLAGEFLVDVHRICSDSPDDDVTHLQKYLQHGRGGVILRVLHTIGIQGLSCSQELAELLASLLPLCLKFPHDDSSQQEEIDLCHIAECFENSPNSYGSPKICSTSPFAPAAVASGNKSIKFPTLTVVGGGSVNDRDGQKTMAESAFQRSMRYHRPVRHSSGNDALTSTSSDSEDEYLRVRSPFKLRVSSHSLIHSNATSPLGVYPGLLGNTSHDHSPVDDGLDAAPEWSGLEPLGMCMLILSLIRDLCHEDVFLIDSKKSVSIQLLPTLTQLFTCLYFDKEGLVDISVSQQSAQDPSKMMSEKEMFMLKRYFVRVILSVGSYVMDQSSGLTILRASSSLPSLLGVAVDIVCKERLQQQESHDYVPDINCIYLAQDIVLGVWLFMEHIFSSIPLNPSVLGLALKLFHDVVSHRGLGIFEGLLGLWERTMLHVEERQQLLPTHAISEPKEQICFIMAVLGKTIRFLKQAKINYIHAVKCSRQKHKKCDYRCYVHHHHDILGLAGSKPYMPGSESCDSMEALDHDHEHNDDTCAVASIGEFLLYLYQKSLCRTTQLKILRCMEESGVCCCMAPGSIIRVLVKNLSGQSPAVRDYTLKVLVCVLLEQCGGAEQVQRSRGTCHICKDDTWRGSESDRIHHLDNREVMFVARQETSDSAFSGSDASLHEDAIRQDCRTPRWQVLKQLQPLVLEKQDADVSVQVMHHALTLVSQGSASMKQELFYCLFMPILQSTKDICHKWSNMEMNAEAETSMPLLVIQHCLVGLPLLLQSPTVHSMFLNYGGIRQLCQLVQVNTLRHSVLGTFQVLIILEERKEESQRGLEFDLQTRHRMEADKTEVKVTEESSLAMERAEEAIESLNSLSAPRFVPHHNRSERNESGYSGQTHDSENTASSILEEFTNMLVLCADQLSSYNKESPSEEPVTASFLSKLVDVWHTCDQLFNQSWQFRSRFLAQDGPRLCLDVCKTSLQHLTLCRHFPAGVPDLRAQDDSSDVFTLWLSLMQASFNVCLASCRVKTSYSLEELTMSLLLQHVKDIIGGSDLWSPKHATAVKHVCDVLLASATVKYSQMDIVQVQVFNIMHLKDEDPIYDKELLELNDPSSSKDTETCFTEQGYEADSEFVTDDTKGTRTKSKTAREVRSHLKTCDYVTYPEVCRLVIELVALYNSRSERSDCTNAVLPHVLLKVLALVRHNGYTAMSLYNQGLLCVLLEGFQSTLTSRLPHAQVKQKLILDLFLSIAKHAVSSQELKMFLELLKAEGVCLDNLLPTALSLVETYKIQPSFILCFPVVKTDFLTHYNVSLKSLSSDILNASIKHVAPPSDCPPRDSLTLPSSGSQGISPYDGESQTDRSESPQPESDCNTTSNTTKSSIWPKTISYHAPLQLDLKDQSMWPSAINNRGFSLSLWLRIEPKNVSDSNSYDWNIREESSDMKKGLWDILGNSGKRRPLPDRLKNALKKHLDSRHWSNQCLHLVSLGNNTVVLEVWTEPHVANLIFRIVSFNDGHQRVLSEAAQSTSLEPNRWHHLTLAFREEFHGERRLATVTTIVDGCFQRESTLEYSLQPTSPPSQESHTSMCVGHVIPVDDLDIVGGNWQLGNLMLFRDCQMTKHTSFHIYALGPDCCTLSHCDCSEQTAMYAQHITDDIVRHSGLSHDVLTGNHTIYLQHLRERLVASYSPHNPTAFSLYSSPPVTSPQQPGGLKGLLRPSSPPKSTFNPLMHQPTVNQARLATDLAPRIHRGLTQALDEIGGFSVFLFAFAKVVEIGSNAHQQAEALRLLFSLMRNNPKYAQDFRNINGHDMLTKVLLSDRCHTGPEIMKVLLDVCLSQPTLVYSQSAQDYHLDHSSCALIRDTQVITDLLLAWQVWENSADGVWGLAFKALEILLRDGHPFQSFNVQQLQNAGVIEKLLMICLERLQDLKPSLPLPVCRSVVTIISKLVGSPPDIHNIMSICDFLLLTHPAASTYICHDDDKFFFRHKWIHQEPNIHIKRKHGDPVKVKVNEMPVSEELTPQVTSTPLKQKPDSAQDPQIQGKIVNKQLFGMKELPRQNQDDGFQSHSLPSTGFWSRLDTNQTSLTKPIPEPINQRLKKGISDAFKTLASSYPQSLNWNRMSDIVSFVQREINIEESSGKGTNLGDFGDSSDRCDSSSDHERGTTSMKKLQTQRKLRPRFRSYSENEAAKISKRKEKYRKMISSGESDSDDSSQDKSPLYDDQIHLAVPRSPNTGRSGKYPRWSSDPAVLSHLEENNTHCYTVFKDFLPNGADSASPDENDNTTVSPKFSKEPSPVADHSENKNESESEDKDPDPVELQSFVLVDSSEVERRKDYEEGLPPYFKEDDWLVYSTGAREPGDPSPSGSPAASKASNTEQPDDEEQGLVFICANLLEFLAKIIVKMPQDDFLTVTGAVLKPQILIIMANHSSPHIRAGVIKVLDMYLMRMTKEQEDQFIKLQGFQLLSCQLHQHVASTKLLEACFTILLGQPHKLEDDILSNMLVEMRPIQQLAVIPLLSMLESTIIDTTLCHNMLCLLGQVFTSVSTMVLPMLSNGLVEVLCNTLCSLSALPPRMTDLGEDERYMLIEGVQKFFCCIAEKCFGSGNVVCFQYLEEMFNILYAVEAKQTDIYGAESEELMYVKTLQSLCLRTVFDYINDMLESQSALLTKSSLTGAVGSLLAKLPLPSANSFSEEDEFSFDEGLAPANPSWPTLNNPNFLSPPMEKKPGETLRSRSLPGTNKESSSLRRRSFTLDPVRRPKVQSSLDIFTSGLFSGKKTQGLSQGELTERVKKMVVIATDFVMFTAHRRTKSRAVSRLETIIVEDVEVIPAEVDFARFLVEFLLKGMVTGLERSIFQRKTLGMSVMWQAKDVLRIQCSRLLVHILSPDQELSQRLYTLELLVNEPKLKDILKITYSIKSMGYKMATYLYELQYSHIREMSNVQRDEAIELTNVLQSLGVWTFKIGRKLSRDEKASMHEDKSLWNQEFVRSRTLWLRSTEEAKIKILQKMDPMAKKLVTQALEVTQGVNKTQNAQRKKFLEHLKKQMSNGVQVKKAWQQLIHQLTHERAVWHDEASYPKSWQLDATEGPCRVRRRLQRCHLGIDEKFLTEENRHKLVADQFDPPLSYLFEDDNLASDSAALLYKLHTSQNIQYTCTCTHVTPSTETVGDLLIGQNDLYFVADEAIKDANYTQVLLGNKDLFISLAQEDVKGLEKRWFQLKDNALEIFLTNGKTSLLAFDSTKERDALYQKLSNLELPNLITGQNLPAIQQLWLEGKMTNFEYLTHLNKKSGRSFNDLMQYPVFPFIVANYDQPTLDLEEEKTYRNLTKPIAVQHKHREDKYCDNYKLLQVEKQRYGDTMLTEYQPEPFHYGSHYSNSGSVLHFLVRLPPFTQMFLDYQDQSFDLPDRTFHNLATSWRLASLESSTDVKELIPEFFFLPEFLCNSEGYNLGRRQTGATVWNVTLPPWCRNDPRLFILVHRQALESAYVTQHIANWIDLVFGYKQTGKAAVEAINVFHPATYCGVDVDSVEDPVRRNALKTMIKTYGQTPRQLFKMSHPSPLLAHQSPKTLDKLKQSPLGTVQGLHWGNYVGSPDQPDPVMTWYKTHRSLIASLVALPTGGVFGLGPCSCLLVMYSKEKGVTAVNTVDVLWAAIVSWGHPDSIVRIKNRKDKPAVNFYHWTTEEQVTCCASVPDCRLLFFGGTSGVITVLNTKFNQSKASDLQVFGQRLCLYGHSGPITSLCVCKPYSIIVSASMDKTLIIWDYNRLSYVRSITDHQNAVYTVAVSDTLGDIASVSHTDHGSCMMLHTVNAQHVSSIECEELVLCLAFSSAPEGRAVNVIAGGLSSGTVSLAFTYDGQRLFAANADGSVAVWEKASSNRPKDVLFVPFL